MPEEDRGWLILQRHSSSPRYFPSWSCPNGSLDSRSGNGRTCMCPCENRCWGTNSHPVILTIIHISTISVTIKNSFLLLLGVLNTHIIILITVIIPLISKGLLCHSMAIWSCKKLNHACHFSFYIVWTQNTNAQTQTVKYISIITRNMITLNGRWKVLSQIAVLNPIPDLWKAYKCMWNRSSGCITRTKAHYQETYRRCVC